MKSTVFLLSFEKTDQGGTAEGEAGAREFSADEFGVRPPRAAPGAEIPRDRCSPFFYGAFP